MYTQFNPTFRWLNNLFFHVCIYVSLLFFHGTIFFYLPLGRIWKCESKVITGSYFDSLLCRSGDTTDALLFGHCGRLSIKRNTNDILKNRGKCLLILPHFFSYFISSLYKIKILLISAFSSFFLRDDPVVKFTHSHFFLQFFSTSLL